MNKLKKSCPCIVFIIQKLFSIFGFNVQPLNKSAYTYKNIQNFQQISNQTLTLKPKQIQQIKQYIQQQKTQLISEVQLVLQINQENPYYSIIQQKLNQLMFQLGDNRKKHYQLLIENDGTSNINLWYKLKTFNGGKANQFYIQFKMSCSAQKYLQISNNISLQKKFDHNLKEFQIIQEFKQNKIKIIYIQYKKIFIASPRDFVYLNYTQKFQDNSYIDISFSITHPKIIQREDFVRGDIILSGSLIKNIPQGCLIKTYSLINMKLSVSPIMVKQPSIKQIRRFIQIRRQYIQQNQSFI